MAENTYPTVSQTMNPVTKEEETPRTRDEARYEIPPVDIYENETGLTVLVDLPGVQREGVSVRVDDDVLTIKGKTTFTHKGEPIYNEFVMRDYFRQFHLNEEVDQEKIRAELKHGVLKLDLPRVQKTPPRQIDVHIG